MSSPHNLPLQLTSFIGREREIAEVKRLLGTSRLLTLIGAGGTGKTRLAVQVGHEISSDYQDGVFFVNLAPVTDWNLVVPTIAQTLVVKEVAGQPLIEALRDYLQGRELLLLLDNFEQVLRAAPLLVDLLVSTPDLRLLVTSREPLHLQGEQLYEVPPLELPDPGQQPSIEELSHKEAVALFMERARSVQPDFHLTERSAHAVAEICLRLDGLPLALELAAPRIRVLTAQELLTHLESRLNLLTGGAQNLPARQQTLRNTIDWSYNLLDSAEKMLFRRLAVFQGGRTLEAIEAVCNAGGDMQVEVLDGVASLVDKNLLRERDGVSGEPRFWMLETIHEYAREKLQESREESVLAHEHALYYARLAEEAESHLTGARQQEWLNRLEKEHDNIRAAIRWAKASKDVDATEIGLRIGAALWRFWDGRGYVSEGREALEALLSAASLRAGEHASKQKRAKALNGVSLLTWRQGHYARAQELLEEALALATEIGDMSTIATSLYNMGLVAWHRGDYAAARSLHERSLALRLEIGDGVGTAYSFHQLGNISYLEGNYAAAKHSYEQGLAVQRELGNKRAIALAFNGLGIVAYMQGDYAAAQNLHGESLALQTELGDKWGTTLSLGNLGNTAYSSGDYSGAERLFKQALAVAQNIGNTYSIAFCLGGLGATTVALGQPTRGTTLLAATDSILQSAGVVLDSDDRIVYAKGLESARSRLSEGEFEKAWRKGRALTIEQAVSYALQDVPEIEPGTTIRVGNATKGKQAYPNDLTRREVEVLRLVAEGLSNNQVAERLFLTANTVRAHLYSAYSKLNVRNRGAAIRFASEHQLV